MTEPLVLLPGLMCDARVFEPQITALSRERAVTVAPVTGGERLEEIASSLLGQLPHRFALAGISFGGIVAQEIVRRAPERVGRLCLMDTTPLAETPSEAAAREPWIVGARAGRFDEVLREAMLPEYFAPGAGRVDVMARYFEMASELGPKVFERQIRAMQRRRDQQGTLRKCKVQTLVLCGAHDGMFPPKRHGFMANLLPNAELKVIEGAGHLPPMEQPAVLLDVLRDWLAKPLVLA